MKKHNGWAAPAFVALAALLMFPVPGSAQITGLITVPRGNSEVIQHPINLERVLIGDPEIADVVTVSAREVVVNGISPGTTTLLFWDVAGVRHTYTVRVTADATTIQSELERIFPDEQITATAVGNTIILSGETLYPRTAARAIELAVSLEPGAEILDHLMVPDPGQVLLQVRVAEVSRSAMRDLGSQLIRVDPFNLRGDDEGMISTGAPAPIGGNLLNTPIGPDATFSDAVNFFLFHRSSNVAAFIQALQREGLFQSLAEPNLMTVPGETASFLAGGEFPYPVAQAGAAGTAVTVEFQEFGVRLSFTPTITNSGAIRMHVHPEVSSLDFSSGLEIAGFQVPALLSRRAQTVVEIEPGQTFAIAGLMDNELAETVRKVPLLGDIPVLGNLFRSSSFQQSRTELLVLVTPHMVVPGMEAPPIPTGEVQDWDWFSHMRPSIEEATP